MKVFDITYITSRQQPQSTYLAGAITDHVGSSLRVEQAICTNGDCNTLLVPKNIGSSNSKISGSREWPAGTFPEQPPLNTNFTTGVISFTHIFSFYFIFDIF